MKLSMSFLVAALFSTSAFACPDLSGSYVCKMDEHEMAFTITQEVKDGVTHYSDGNGSFAADGVTYNLPDESNWKNTTRTASCSETALNIKFEGDNYADETLMGHLSTDTNYSKNDDGNFHIKGTAVMTDGAGANPKTEEFEMVCEQPIRISRAVKSGSVFKIGNSL